jgi:hypothetical protein
MCGNLTNFSSIKSDFYVSKTCNYIYNEHPLGRKTEGITKFLLGYLLGTILLTLVIGPLVLFSALGGMLKNNPVVSGNVQFWIQVNSTILI